MAADALAQADPGALSPGTLIAGKYRVRGEIGRGGMGRVVAATNLTTGREVALKWILDGSSESAGARFAREARAIGRVRHPNVVDVYDVVVDGGATCIVMELLAGETLSRLLAREGPLPIERAVGLAIEIGRGLSAAHAAGIVHRDLKPANVFICDGSGETGVKILDFGISKEIAEPSDVTDTGVVLGTPQYVAPEQVMSASDVDHRADIYALGTVLYEMLAGRPPHVQAHVPALLVEIAIVAPRPLSQARPDVPAALSAVVAKAMAKDREGRYPTVEGLLAELRRASVANAPSEPAAAVDAATLDPARPAAAPAGLTPREAPTLDERAAARETPLAAPTPHSAPLRPALWRGAAMAAIAVTAVAAAWWSTSGEPSRPAAASPSTAAPFTAPSVALSPPRPDPSVTAVSADPGTPPAEPSEARARPPRLSTRRGGVARGFDAPEVGSLASTAARPPEVGSLASTTAPEASVPPAEGVAPTDERDPSTPAPRAGRIRLDDL